MNEIIVVLLIVLYVLGIAFSPFPYLKTYFVLWRYVLADPNPHIGLAARFRQGRFLLGYAAMTPVWTALWYLDELFFRAYRQQEIQLVFIIGQPRSGSTFLHRTLAADEDTFFAVRHIEWRYPFISLQKLFGWLGIADRLSRANYWPDTEAGHAAARMHPNRLSDWEEDGIFYEERFLHHFFVFLRFPFPNLLTYLDDFPSLPPRVRCRILNTHRQVLQKVAYMRGASARWYLSKEVTSHNKLLELSTLYPTARFIITLRDADEFMSSLLKLMRTSTLTKTGLDPDTIPGWRGTVVERMRRDSNLLGELWLQETGLHRQIKLAVSFQELTTNVVTSVRSIYRQIGKVPSDAYLAHLRQLQGVQKTRTRGYDYERARFPGFDGYNALVQASETSVRT